MEVWHRACSNTLPSAPERTNTQKANEGERNAQSDGGVPMAAWAVFGAVGVARAADVTLYEVNEAVKLDAKKGGKFKSNAGTLTGWADGRHRRSVRSSWSMRSTSRRPRTRSCGLSDRGDRQGGRRHGDRSRRREVHRVVPGQERRRRAGNHRDDRQAQRHHQHVAGVPARPVLSARSAASTRSKARRTRSRRGTRRRAPSAGRSGSPSSWKV